MGAGYFGQVRLCHSSAMVRTSGRASASVPDGTIDGCLRSPNRMRDQEPSVSIVPDGTYVFAPFPSTELLGYFHQVPPGPVLFGYS
jgi:hypothetical protein